MGLVFAAAAVVRVVVMVMEVWLKTDHPVCPLRHS